MTGRLVFVYGTLRKGDCRFGIESLVDQLHEEAYLEGFQLAHFGGFPGIVPGKGRVRGEVHLYSTFDELDRIEGFNEKYPDRSLFKREKVMVELPTGDILQASTYVFNARSGRKQRIIESGDWFDERPPRRGFERSSSR